MSTRQSIVDALQTLFEGIRKADGFYTDAGKNVYNWRLAELTDACLPAIVFRDTTDPMVDEGVVDKIDHELTIEVDCHTKPVTGSTPEKEARNLAQDVMVALGAGLTLGGYCYDIRVTSSEMMVKDANRRYAAMMLVLTVKYRTSRWSL